MESLALSRFSVEVWGDYALFTRPELKAERVTYEVMTPSAARGIMDAIYWHPGVKWVIDSIRVCNPIKFINIRTNEIKAVANVNNMFDAIIKKSVRPYIDRSKDYTQRSSLVLKDVRYIIEAHFIITNSSIPDINPGKITGITSRRLEKGACYKQPYLGCRDYPAYFKKAEIVPDCPPELKGDRDLGYMLYDLEFPEMTGDNKIRRLSFRARMQDGFIKIPTRNSGEVIA